MKLYELDYMEAFNQNPALTLYCGNMLIFTRLSSWTGRFT